MHGRGRAAGVEGGLGLSGTRVSQIWTSGSCGDVAAALPASRAFSTASGHPRSNKHMHGLDLRKGRVGEQAERKKSECVAGERHTIPTVHGTFSAFSRAA